MESAVLVIFCCMLAVCVATGVPTALALLAGLVIFVVYTRLRAYSWKSIGQMCASGIKSVSTILIAFLLIGAMTALWRGCGTIPAIVVGTAGAIHPTVFYLMAFLLNALLSTLTGTSFGTSATMGVICMAVGMSLGMDPVVTGGAILGGAFVGDRCSTVSTSAMLVATVTSTDLIENIKGMLRRGVVPFVLSCLVYLVLGVVMPGQGAAAAGGDLVTSNTSVVALANAFDVSWPTLLPAAAVLLLPVLRVGVKPAMGVSIVLAAGVCLFCQACSPLEVLQWAVFGYASGDPQVASLLNGGGVTSMVNVTAVVCISSCYAGIFDKTGLLDGAKAAIARISEATTPFVGTVCASILTCVIACNQSLATLLTQQLAKDAEPNGKRLALYMEDSVIVIAAAIPWSIAGAVPLAAVGAPTASILAACFLYLTPLCGIALSYIAKDDKGTGTLSR